MSGAGRLGVVISLFTYESTFIARELEELHRLGIEIVVYSLRRPSLADRRWFEAHLPRATLRSPAYLLSAEVAVALLRALLTRPAILLRLLAGLCRDAAGSPRVLLRTLAVVPKSLAIAFDLDRRRVDRVHAHWATVAASSAWMAAAVARRPFSFTAHAWDIMFDDCLHRRKLQAAEFAVTCNAFGRDYLLARQGAEFAPKVHLLYHGLDLSAYAPPAVGERQAGLILAVGRLTEQKGFHVLVEACGRLRDRGVHFVCRIAGGDGDCAERVRRGISSLRLEGQVSLLGFVEPEQVVPLYRQATVVASPTVIARHGETDGLPNVVIEAMACGTPVVGSTAAGLPEAIVHGENGWLVSPGEAEALAEGLEAVLRDSALQQRLGAAARRTALARFDVRRNTEALRALLFGARVSDATVSTPNSVGGRG